MPTRVIILPCNLSPEEYRRKTLDEERANLIVESLGSEEGRRRLVESFRREMSPIMPTIIPITTWGIR